MSQASPSAASHTPRRLTDKPSDESLKETFQSVVIAFILAFVFRAYIVEAFVIPTGSMAPTLLGQHFHTTCQQCGYTFNVDSQSRPRDYNKALLNTHVVCPMCHFPNNVSARTPAAAGDRILIHKFIYNIVEPTRWDVVVFKEPANPSTNFIKRLIGLPGENIWIIEGNIYTQSPDPAGQPGKWRIARKSDARLGAATQRDLWQPVYHSQYVPLDGGTLSLQRQVGSINYTWENPWTPDSPQHWNIGLQRSYTYSQNTPGHIHFDFTKALDPLQITWYPYNQFQANSALRDKLQVPTEDLRLAATFEPQQQGLQVVLSTQARLDADSRPHTLQAVVNDQGQAWLQAVAPDGDTRRLTEPAHVGTFTPGKGTQVELWYVDQEASLWVQGRLIASRKFDIEIESIARRPPLTTLPQPDIAVQGSPVTLHDVQVDRDVFYTSTLINDSSLGLGTLIKDEYGMRGQPVQLQQDQFFCLGDNSPLSSDSRFWRDVNPWIEKRMLADSPQKTGIVPRKLMMGRAFFVYFPATHPIKPGYAAIIPNFGDLRFIH